MSLHLEGNLKTSMGKYCMCHPLISSMAHRTLSEIFNLQVQYDDIIMSIYKFLLSHCYTFLLKFNFWSSLVIPYLKINEKPVVNLIDCCEARYNMLYSMFLFVYIRVWGHSWWVFLLGGGHNFLSESQTFPRRTLPKYFYKFTVPSFPTPSCIHLLRVCGSISL